MTPHRLAWSLVILGAAIAIIGVALFSIPLAVILAGTAIAAMGLLVIEVKP
jgi:hypothetical protein